MLNSLFAINIENVEFENQISGNTGKVKTYPWGYYQVFRLYLAGWTFSKIYLKSIISTKYLPLNKFYDIETLVWFISLKYAYLNNADFSIGNQRLNFSPYILHSEEWQDNFLRAIYFNYKNEILNFVGFIGCHTEWTNSKYFKNKLVKINAGFISYHYVNGVKSEGPSIWAGTKFDYKNLFSFIYLHENYSYDRAGYGYYIFNNDIFGSYFNIYQLKFLKFTIFYSLMLKKYDAYRGYWNYYGEGKHRLFLDYSEIKNYPAYEVKTEFVKNDEKNLIKNFNIKLILRNIDKNYNPLHMDTPTFDENRGEDDLENLYPGMKGYIVNFVKPVLKNFKIGYEYREFDEFKENRIITQILFFKIVYRIPKIKDSNFATPVNLNGFYITGEINLKNNLKIFLKYVENRYFIKNRNEFLARLNYVF
jgi:hypothetical protein